MLDDATGDRIIDLEASPNERADRLDARERELDGRVGQLRRAEALKGDGAH